MRMLRLSYDLAAQSLRQCRQLLAGGRWDHRRYLERRFYRLYGRWPDLDSPVRLSDKLLWLNVNYRHPLMPPLADKFLARAIVGERAGAEILVDLLGTWDRPQDIQFDRLPNAFALKATAGSGWNIICQDKSKLDIPATLAKLQSWMDQSYYHKYFEWPYEGLKSRVIAEPFLADPDYPQRSLPDYKFYCFNGQPHYLSICTDRRGNGRWDFFDRNWQTPDLCFDKAPRSETPPPCPPNFERMLSVAARLADGFPFVRVDLYNRRGQVLFGEMTWFPSAGFLRIDPPGADEMLGNLLTLPNVRSAAAA